MHSVYDCCIPVLVAALTVLILGCLNPPMLQTKKYNKPTGNPNYMWLALLALVAGCLTCVLMFYGKQGMGMGMGGGGGGFGGGGGLFGGPVAGPAGPMERRRSSHHSNMGNSSAALQF